MRTILVATAGLVALAMLVPGATAHPTAVVVDNPLVDARCYVYEDDGDTELWIESNGVVTGGVPAATDRTGLTSGGSGLQREAFEDADGRSHDADTFVPLDDLGHWLHVCNEDHHE